MSELKSVLDDIRRGLLRNQQILRQLDLETLESRERMNRCHDLLAGLTAKLCPSPSFRAGAKAPDPESITRDQYGFRARGLSPAPRNDVVC